VYLGICNADDHDQLNFVSNFFIAPQTIRTSSFVLSYCLKPFSHHLAIQYNILHYKYYIMYGNVIIIIRDRSIPTTAIRVDRKTHCQTHILSRHELPIIGYLQAAKAQKTCGSIGYGFRYHYNARNSTYYNNTYINYVYKLLREFFLFVTGKPIIRINGMPCGVFYRIEYKCVCVCVCVIIILTIIL